MLRGRATEGAILDRMLAGVRAGDSAVLVLRGEAGIGKSALLEYAAERAAGCRLLRAAGVESEMELPFAGLHQLCAPLFDGIDGLPEPQRDALDAAFGRRAGARPDRFALALGFLSLISAAAEREPVVCLIDDAHWLDASSAQALGFVARRIRDTPVGLLLAERDGLERDDLAGLPSLRLEGLADGDARALLTAAAGTPLDARIRDRIVVETHGNPLALLEMPRGLSPAALTGGFHADDSAPLPSRIEASFRRRVAALAPETQRLLLVAAAEPIGDATLLWQALAEIGIPVEAASAAQSAGLLDTGARITFRHPLLRSAIYRAASPEDRRAVHAALAAVTDAAIDPDRRAWHRAQATLGPDEAVAEELMQAADRAQVRGGFPAAAAFLERATALTLDPRLRAARALAAAQAMREAGAFDDAVDLLGQAESSGGLDALGAARAALLRGQIAFVAGHMSAAVPLFLEAADRLKPLDPSLARDTYREAFHAAFAAGRFREGGGTREVAAAARRAPPVNGRPGPQDLLLDGLAVMLTDGYAVGSPLVQTALKAFRAEDLSVRDGLDWLPLACRMALNVFDFESWDVLSARLVDVAREAGALAVLPIAMVLRVSNRLFAGQFDVAAALNAEVEALGEATGRRYMMSYANVSLAAWSGQEAATDEAIALACQQLSVHEAGQLLTNMQWARAVLYNGLGRFDAALAEAERACEYPDELGVATWALVELIEAAALSGDADRAAAGLAELVPLTQASATDWALGTETRTRALVEKDAAEPLYRTSIAHLSRTGMRVGLARTHLHYGEWLRGESRRTDAREHLRIAHDAFATMGAAAFADRAARSLLATGEKARRRTDDTRGDLTAQEAQIAELARQGLSNPEIGARLFISPRTVEYHLHKVFGKLGITARTQLAQVLGAGDGRDGVE
jgi:DNA-binding CsgD family transcriptional regulator